MLLATADPRVSRDFAAKWLEGLSSEERLLLKMYFLHHLSLKETSTALYVHKKTLQYRLDKIAEKSGLDPRHFQGAVKIYIALLFQDGDV